jgi:hypothetical protein
MSAVKENWTSGEIVLMPEDGIHRFVGLAVSADLISCHISELLSLGIEEKYFRNHRAAYGGKYHVTLIDSVEFSSVEKSKLPEVLGAKVDVRFIGLGSAGNCLERCFFVVCESIDMCSLRKKLSLPSKDFHITLGYANKDLHDVHKGRDSLLEK